MQRGSWRKRESANCNSSRDEESPKCRGTNSRSGASLTSKKQHERETTKRKRRAF